MQRRPFNLSLLSRKKAEILILIAYAAASFSLFFYTKARCLSILFLIPLFYIIPKYCLREIRESKDLGRRDLLFLLSFTAFSLILFFIHQVIFKHLDIGLLREPALSDFLFPYTMIPITIRVIFPGSVTIMYVVSLSILFSMLASFNLWVFIYSFFSGVVASYVVANCKKRSSLLYGGLIASFSNIAVLFALLISIGAFTTDSLVTALSTGIISGGMGGLISVGLIPVSEIAFGFTTNLTLLELGTLDHPLLKELALRAPGTYYHSMMVSTLSEMAAEEVKANSLLAKVGAYFHDIGKLKKPEYFIENQGLVNKHSKLSPHMSALILKSHVKDGVELARKYKLGEKIISIIQQHHGTSLITFFYKKAIDMGEEIDEREFRYPGPRPQFKEAAIIMMADVVEAASRTLTEPSPSRIKGLVFNAINNLIRDGQLDESDLTFKDLKIIGNTFVRVLTGIYHKRIEYPETESAKEGHESRAFRGGKITPFPRGTLKNSPDGKRKGAWKGK